MEGHHNWLKRDYEWDFSGLRGGGVHLNGRKVPHLFPISEVKCDKVNFHALHPSEFQSAEIQSLSHESDMNVLPGEISGEWMRAFKEVSYTSYCKTG